MARRWRGAAKANGEYRKHQQRRHRTAPNVFSVRRGTPDSVRFPSSRILQQDCRQFHEPCERVFLFSLDIPPDRSRKDSGRLLRPACVCDRSEERRVGKECRLRWWLDYLKKKKTEIVS